MATIQLRLSSKASNGRAEVLCRFYEGSVGFRAKTRLYAICDAWDGHCERMVVPKKHTSQSQEIQATNARIDALCEHIHRQWAMYRYADNPSSWLQAQIDTMQQVASPKKAATLLDCVCAYADARAAQVNTYKNIMVLAHALEAFAKPVNMAAVTPAYVEAFAGYLRSYLSDNTSKKMLSQMRSVCNKAVDDELLARSPFGGSRGYVIGQPIYGSPHYLTTEERDLLTVVDLPPKLAVQRDVFIFQCHCGCRVSDLIRLTHDNILPGGWLEYVPQKTSHVTGRTVRVPLSQVAMEIVDRYRHTYMVRGRDEKGCEFAEFVSDPAYYAPTLLPFICEQKYNRAIHDMFVLAGLTRPIVTLDKHTGEPTTCTLADIATSHLARKTFSQQVYSRSGSERIAASFTGHSPNSKAFSRYNEVSDEMKRAVIGV